MNKIPGWHEEFRRALGEIALIYCLSPKDLLPFLAATLSGQFALAGLNENQVKEALDRMFKSYKKIKERMEKENERSP